LATGALGLVVVAVVPALWGVLVGAAVLGVGTALLTPAVFVAIFAVVPDSERGSAAGTASVFIDLGLGGGPMIVGFVAAAGGISAGFLAAAALATGGAALLAARPRAAGARAD
jgi:MFS family permease